MISYQGKLWQKVYMGRKIQAKTKENIFAMDNLKKDKWKQSLDSSKISSSFAQQFNSKIFLNIMQI
jgi:hypothetical protein